MAPWTFIGSLISYFKSTGGANYYVELYAAYYFAGLPVSLLQQQASLTRAQQDDRRPRELLQFPSFAGLQHATLAQSPRLAQNMQGSCNRPS